MNGPVVDSVAQVASVAAAHRLSARHPRRSAHIHGYWTGPGVELAASEHRKATPSRPASVGVSVVARGRDGREVWHVKASGPVRVEWVHDLVRDALAEHAQTVGAAA